MAETRKRRGRVSTFNRCVGREVKDGASFKQGVSRCKNRTRSGRRRSRSR